MICGCSIVVLGWGKGVRTAEHRIICYVSEVIAEDMLGPLEESSWLDCVLLCVSVFVQVQEEMSNELQSNTNFPDLAKNFLTLDQIQISCI